jgi:hypothetical protein
MGGVVLRPSSSKARKNGPRITLCERLDLPFGVIPRIKSGASPAGSDQSKSLLPGAPVTHACCFLDKLKALHRCFG